MDRARLGAATTRMDAISISRRLFLRWASGAAAYAMMPRVIADRRFIESAASVAGASQSPTTATSQARARKHLTPDMLFGAQLTPEEVLTDPAICELAVETCDVLVMAGGVFWGSMEPARGQLNFKRCDEILDFASRNAMAVRGHTLVYHTALPTWLQSIVNTTNGLDLLLKHVGLMVDRFRGRVPYWDVLNEIITPTDGRPDMLRNSIWLRMCGPAYVAEALRTARAADPKAKLGYNEYGIEDDSTAADLKRSGVLALLRNLKAQNVPIDYLGVQSHLMPGQAYSNKKLGTFLRGVRDLGLEVLLTELDVQDSALPADIGTRDAAVADLYGRYLDVALESGPIRMITTWGLTDRTSWYQSIKPRHDGLPQRPLPFDDKLRAKPAWDAIVARNIVRKPGPFGCPSNVKALSCPESLEMELSQG